MSVNIPETKTYSQCLDLISKHLRDMAENHGALKEWCTKEGLNYNTCVKIKNKKLNFYLPNMVVKLLNKLGYKATLSRQYLDDQESPEDVFIVIKTKNAKDPG